MNNNQLNCYSNTTTTDSNDDTDTDTTTRSSMILLLQQYSYIPIHHLPLKRSTISILRNCGYTTIQDIYNTMTTCSILQSQNDHDNDDHVVVGTEQRERNVAICYNLARELQHQFRSSSSSINSNSNIHNNTIENGDTLITEELLQYTVSIYQELIDAIRLVVADDSENDIDNNCDTNSIVRGSAATSDMSTTTTTKTAADILRIHHNLLSGTSKRNNIITTTNNTNAITNTTIITFCRELDVLLQGGIAIGEITELVGLPSSGKTNICIQLAVNTMIPQYCGGIAGRTIYIDTEGSFSIERCYTFAVSLIQHIQTGLQRKKLLLQQQRNKRQRTTGTTLNANANANTNTSIDDTDYYEWNVTVQDILQNIFVYRVHDVVELSAIIHGAIPNLIQMQQSQQPSSSSSSLPNELPIRLIIIDSIAFPYRAATAIGSKGDTTMNHTLPSSSSICMDYNTRTQHLMDTVATLSKYAVQYQLAVITVNQMTTKFVSNTITNTNNNENDMNLYNNDNNNNNNDTNNVPHEQQKQQQQSMSSQRTMLVPALGESWAHAITTRLLVSKDSYNTNHNNTTYHRHSSNSVHHQNNVTEQILPKYQYRTCTLLKSPRLSCGEAKFVITDVGIRGIEYIQATIAKANMKAKVNTAVTT